MFSLEFIEAENWCQHKARRIEFVPGTNGMVGPNGAGKSNMLLAGFTALTGAALVGNLADNIFWEASKTKVATGFNLDGLHGVITRTFEASYIDVIIEGTTEKKKIRGDLRSTARLTLGDGATKLDIKGVRAVNQKIEELTGLSSNVITDHIFITQGHLFDLLFTTSSARMDAFLSLIPEVSAAEMRREDIKGELELFPAVETGVALDEVKKQCEACTVKLNSATVELVQTRTARGPGVIADFRATAAAGAAAEQRRTAKRVAEDRLASTTETSTQYRSAVALLENDVKEYQKVLDDLAADAKAAEATLAAVENNKAIAENRRMAESGLAHAKEELEIAEPAPFTQEPELVLLNQRRDQLMAQYGPAVAFSRFLETGKNECPTCLAKHENPAARLVEQRAIIAKLMPQIEEANTKITALVRAKQAAESAKVRYDGEVRRLKGLIASYENTLATLPVVQATEDAATGDLADLVKAYADTKQDLQTLRDRLSKNRALLEATERRAHELITEIGELTRLLEKAPSKEEATAAGLAAEELVELDKKIAGFEGTVKALTEERDRWVAQEADIARVETQAASVREYRRLLAHARDGILHRDFLPQEVLLSRIGELEDACNRYLDLFGKPFVLRIERDMNIMVMFPSGYEAPAERLSGGQRCVLSMAFRVAINDLFAPKLGFVVLDEPTEFTDRDNVRYIADMVEKVSSRGREGGLQVIVITHAEELIPAFENVIRITGG